MKAKPISANMKKEDIYEIRKLFQKIAHDYTNDVGKQADGSAICRATLIEDSIERGVEICNNSINKMEPLK
ncbi:hypothetical protein LCGC14_0537030 [marine sediment metagenome]|uniref:Uncharacterized protein n=1 Tax=marine sediment metagenome TaxID=412755 RepID=A0A0F9V251_9ZZZZ